MVAVVVEEDLWNNRAPAITVTPKGSNKMSREFDSADRGQKGHDRRLPLGGSAKAPERSRRVIAHHLILTDRIRALVA